VDVESRGTNDETPLHYAAYGGHLAVVQYLCEHGTDKEARAASGSTPLHLTAQDGGLPVVQYVCEQGADKEVRITVAGHHCTGQHTLVTSLWYSTSVHNIYYNIY